MTLGAREFLLYAPAFRLEQRTYLRLRWSSSSAARACLTLAWALETMPMRDDTPPRIFSARGVIIYRHKSAQLMGFITRKRQRLIFGVMTFSRCDWLSPLHFSYFRRFPTFLAASVSIDTARSASMHGISPQIGSRAAIAPRRHDRHDVWLI